MSETPMFRAPKRRKATTRHAEAATASENEPAEPDMAVLKRQLPTKKRGAQFTSTIASHQTHRGDDELGSVTKSSQSETTLIGLQSRFVGAGGSTQLTNTDRYMTDFIDRAITERTKSVEPHSTQSQFSSNHGTILNSPSETGDEARSTTQHEAFEPKSEGRYIQPLSEVDLGPGAVSSNLTGTAAATTGQVTDAAAAKKPRPKRPRLGPDGKPWRPRPRKGPNPEDLARSALVDQVLHESGLTSCDYSSRQTERAGVDEAADEKMAAEFQQQFLESMAERQERQQQRQTQSAKAKKDTNTGDGPRLGGSRNARAKMAAAQSTITAEQK